MIWKSINNVPKSLHKFVGKLGNEYILTSVSILNKELDNEKPWKHFKK